jgi:CRP-like cAMP-binding protein
MIKIMSQAIPSQLEGLPSERLQYAAGGLVFRRDAPVDWLHFVKRGLVHLLRYKADGGLTVLQRAEPGYFLAEASLFSPTYHCDAVAITPTELVRFPKSAVLSALAADPNFALSWVQYLSREMQRMRSRAELLSLKKVSDRFEAWLELRGCVMPEKGQWVSVAREIGVSPEALYRYLAANRRAPPSAS